jgi:hypothetical protein
MIYSILVADRGGIFEARRDAQGMLDELESRVCPIPNEINFTKSKDSLVFDSLTSTNHISDVAFGQLVITDIEPWHIGIF